MKCQHQWFTTTLDGASVTTCERCTAPGVRIVLVPVGAEAVLVGIEDGLDAMQAVVGGRVERVCLLDPAVPGLELWCNEEAGFNGSVLNRCIPAAPRGVPEGYDFVVCTDDDLVAPGEAGVWRISGDFFLCRYTDDGELADATEADLTWAQSVTAHGISPVRVQMQAEWRASKR
jgi:hypothetical protein